VKLRITIIMLALLFSAAVRAEFTFALLGDTPYGASEEPSFNSMLQEINRNDVAFTVHVGDFKNGWTSCSDAVFEQRRALFDASQHAFIYIPGDNEWTDCSRLLAGRYDPLERLAALRVRFFSGPLSLGQSPLKLARQSDDPAAPPYPEHMRWQHNGILFVALNIPGSNNNLAMKQESNTRTAAALLWLQQSFALARTHKTPGIVVMMQANPFLPSGNARRGYDVLVSALAQETANFHGSVLLGHGDTHSYRVDRPLRDGHSGRVLENFTRAEVFGSPDVNWLRVRVSESSGRAVFTISAGR
jgi:hypothetical protein